MNLFDKSSFGGVEWGMADVPMRPAGVGLAVPKSALGKRGREEMSPNMPVDGGAGRGGPAVVPVVPAGGAAGRGGRGRGRGMVDEDDEEGGAGGAAGGAGRGGPAVVPVGRGGPAVVPVGRGRADGGAGRGMVDEGDEDDEDDEEGGDGRAGGAAGGAGGAAGGAGPKAKRQKLKGEKPEKPDLSLIIKRILSASEIIEQKFVQPAQPEGEAIPGPAGDAASIIMPAGLGELVDAVADQLNAVQGGDGDGIVFPEGAVAAGVTQYINADDIAGITAKLQAVFGGGPVPVPAADKIQKFNKLLRAICTYPAAAVPPKTPNTSTIKRIIGDLVHDAGAHAREYNVHGYLCGLMPGEAGCIVSVNTMYDKILVNANPDSGIKPKAIHDEEETLLKEIGTIYPGVLPSSLSNNIFMDDISKDEETNKFIGKLRDASIKYIIIDSQSGNPVCRIFKERGGAGAIQFKIVNQPAAEADGASKVGKAKTDPVGIAIDDKFLDIAIPVRNTYANYTHTISFAAGQPKIVVKNGAGADLCTFTGAAGFSINSLCKAAGIALPRKGKNPKVTTIEGLDGDANRSKKQAEALLIKPLTDLAQVYFAALLYHVYGIKTVFVTMDSYCLYVAAIFCLPVVMYAHPGGQRIYSFAKNVFTLDKDQIKSIYRKLKTFHRLSWADIKAKIDSIRNRFRIILNNTPYIFPFIIAKRVLSDIDQIEKESAAKFQSIQDALNAFANAASTPADKFQHIKNHSSLISLEVEMDEDNSIKHNYIFNEQAFIKNVTESIKDLYSTLSFTVEKNNLHNPNSWPVLKVGIDTVVNELTTILTDYGYPGSHEELIAIYIAQQLTQNPYIQKIFFRNYGAAGGAGGAGANNLIPDDYKIYFKYWTVLNTLFGVANKIVQANEHPDIWDKIKGTYDSFTKKFKENIIYTIPISFYLNIDLSIDAGGLLDLKLPLPAGEAGTPLQITVDHIKAGVTAFLNNDVINIGRAPIAQQNPADNVIIQKFKGTVNELGADAENSLFKHRVPAPAKEHIFYKFVKDMLGTVNNEGNVVGDLGGDKLPLINKVLSYIYTNLNAAFKSRGPTDKVFKSNFVIDQVGGGEGSTTEEEAEESVLDEEETEEPNEYLLEVLEEIRSQTDETDKAAAIFKEFKEPAHPSIEQSVDDAIKDAQCILNLTTPAPRETIMFSLLNLLYSLQYDAAESHEGTRYLARYHTLSSLLDEVTDPTDLRNILRYYLVQEEYMSKYTTSLIPPDIIYNFLQAFDRLFGVAVIAPTVTADMVRSEEKPSSNITEGGDTNRTSEQGPVNQPQTNQAPLELQRQQEQPEQERQPLPQSQQEVQDQPQNQQLLLQKQQMMQGQQNQQLLLQKQQMMQGQQNQQLLPPNQQDIRYQSETQPSFAQPGLAGGARRTRRRRIRRTRRRYQTNPRQRRTIRRRRDRTSRNRTANQPRHKNDTLIAE